MGRLETEKEKRSVMAELKLTIELVPRPLWYRDLKKLIPPKEWKRLRGEVLERDKNCCRVCGDAGNICHEVWYYDDVNHIQRLTGLIILCDMCNHCKHMDHAGILWREGKLDFRAVIDHFCRVNGISEAEFRTVYMEARKQWRERSKYTDWTQDFGEYSGLVP